MSPPIDFLASATALACYEACPRRFRHRYLDHLPAGGPDPQTAEKTRRGDLFHRLVLWHDLGLDTDVILESEDDPLLEAQWTVYRAFQASLDCGGSQIQHDRSIVAHCAGYPVQARIDALVVDSTGGVTIYDWKTSQRPSPARLIESQQSRVYPYVVWETLRRRPGSMLTDPEQIRLVYWFPSHPGDPFEIPYSSERFAAGSAWLEDLLSTIASDHRFDMTADRTRCQKCEYIAHCGVTPEDGEPMDLDEDYHQPLDLPDDSAFDRAVLLH